MSHAYELGLSEKQLILRQSGIGASEIAAVAGIVPGAVAVWERKAGLAPEFEGTSLTEFGHRIEGVIADAYKDRHPGISIFTPGTLRHPKVPIALASPDRVVVPPNRRAREVWQSLLEIKTVFFAGAQFGEEGTDEVPEKYLAQVQWQLEVCDLQNATLVALVNGDYREFPISRDREFGGLLLDAAQKWWTDYVVKGVPPPPDGSDEYASYLRRRYPSNLKPALQPTPELVAAVTYYRETKEHLDQAEALASEAKQELQALIGETEGIAGLASWKQNKPSTSVDWEAVAGELRRYLAPGLDSVIGGLVAKHTTTKPGARVLRLATTKKEK